MGKIITISRQYGSGGSEIGRKVAKALSIPYYDRTIIDVTAKESGFDPKYIERAEQTTTTSFLYNLAINGIHTAAYRPAFLGGVQSYQGSCG